ncbi:hypothetical protein QJ857_gp1214 [Tupanvirus soda lake]|uniref:Uncharacterized protein n=2 Tax=Tupanvirus TaxID=2094720 RepID=A0A6N1P141_9VIRU|nr:hypothetical protein QJ857_gp1214 [Tupanvirus soda lake]QKU34841.1 hypothetical protein [Tupanvirus soda lake]
MNYSFELHEFKYLTVEYKGDFFENQNNYIFRIKVFPEDILINSLSYHEKYNTLVNHIKNVYFVELDKADAQITFFMAGVMHVIKLPIEVLSIEDKYRLYLIKLKPKIENVSIERMAGFNICTINIDFTDFLKQLEYFNCINVV